MIVFPDDDEENLSLAYLRLRHRNIFEAFVVKVASIFSYVVYWMTERSVVLPPTVIWLPPKMNNFISTKRSLPMTHSTQLPRPSCPTADWLSRKANAPADQSESVESLPATECSGYSQQ
jgi:hypothetical protein